MDNESRNPYGLIVVSAPSGAGKSTLCARLLKNHSDRLSLSISTTSRPPRGQEQNGREYFFVNANEFQGKISASEFAEWALVHENYYGTEKRTLQEFWGKKRHVLLDIDVQGTATLKALYADRCFTVFIAPPSMEELERRLRGRGTETEAVIQKRMKNSIEEMSRKDEFDVIIVNDDIDQAYQTLDLAVMKFMDELESGTWRRRL